MDYQGLHGAGVDPRPEGASLLYDSRIDPFSAAASVYITREHARLRTTRHFV